MNIRIVACVAFSVLASRPAFADTLSDMKNALRSLASAEPVSGTLTIEQSVSSAGRFGNNKNARLVSADVSHDANGVTITIPQDLVRKVSDQALSRGAEDATAEDAIGSIRVPAVIEALNVRDLLLALLEDSTLVEERRVTAGTRTTRVVVVNVKPRKRPSGNSLQVGSVKSEDRLRLTVGDDHLPLTAERNQSTTAGFMFLHGTYTAHSLYAFTHRGDRLVLARLEVTEGGSGIGQKFDKHSVQTLTVR